MSPMTDLQDTDDQYREHDVSEHEAMYESGGVRVVVPRLATRIMRRTRRLLKPTAKRSALPVVETDINAQGDPFLFDETIVGKSTTLIPNLTESPGFILKDRVRRD